MMCHCQGVGRGKTSESGEIKKKIVRLVVHRDKFRRLVSNRSVTQGQSVAVATYDEQVEGKGVVWRSSFSTNITSIFIHSTT